MTNNSSAGVERHLEYLEFVRDFESGVDRGPLAGKELLIYSPSKTGTVSLYHGLGTLFQNIHKWPSYVPKVLHNHSNRELLACLDKGSPRSDGVNATNRCVVSDLIEYKRITGGRVRIVSSYRDPIRRALSALYDALHNKIIRDREISSVDVSVDLCEEILTGILTYQSSATHPLEELEPEFFNVRQFRKASSVAHPDFFHEVEDHYELLIVTLEQSVHWSRIVELAFGHSGARFEHRNRAIDKPIMSVCQPFVERVRLPRDLLDAVYYSARSGRYASWHYTEHALDTFHKAALREFLRDA